ncbi:MAG TPA: metallophosphoesterase, partial [Chloroflexota bacterium]|nr:metallophosphoesterase [Chloroflexota bacterium]
NLFLQVGDLFDTPDPRNLERQFVAEQLAGLRDAGIACIGIGGNHDTPRSRGDRPAATPMSPYASLGGLRLLEGQGTVDSELLELEGMRVAVGGLEPDPTAQPGSDPLDGVDWAPDADFSLLLVHGSPEGHIYPDAPEAILRRQTVDRLHGIDCILAGHVHRHAVFHWGSTTVIVPGATERMTFADLEERPGFVYMELERHHIARIDHLPVQAQPRRTLLIPTSELADSGIAEQVMGMMEGVCAPDALVRVTLAGPITRQRYHDLHLRDLAEFGAARCFFLDLDTTGLFLEDEAKLTIFRGGRLSQREELIRFARESRDAATTDEERSLVDDALIAILEEYS